MSRLGSAPGALLSLVLSSLLLTGACAGGSGSDTAASGTDTAAAPSPTSSASSPSTSASTTSADDSSPTSAQSEAAAAEVIAVAFRNGKATPKPRRVEVSQGQRVRIEVSSDAGDEVHVHGYDLTADLKPGRTGVVTFQADQPGLYEVEVENAGVLLFQLLVR